MVERPLCMREVPGSIPGFSRKFFLFFFNSILCLHGKEIKILNVKNYEAVRK